MTPAQILLAVPDGHSKTELVRWKALQGSIEPLVRQTAVRLVSSAPRFDHSERVRRLHRFVRDSVPYMREAVETLQSATLTLEEGGDCDDHCILLCALAWSVRYPFIVEPVGPASSPDHYSTRLGIPPAENPHGDKETRWFQAETTLPAQFGESLASFSRLQELEFLG